MKSRLVLAALGAAAMSVSMTACGSSDVENTAAAQKVVTQVQTVTQAAEPDAAAIKEAAKEAVAAEKRRVGRRAATRRAAEKRAAKRRAAEKRKAERAAAASASGSGGGNCITVPNVVGKDHQLAQDTMQAAGLYMLDEEDATGQGRMLILDRNWTTVAQKPAAGQCVSEDTTILLSAKKDGE